MSAKWSIIGVLCFVPSIAVAQTAETAVPDSLTIQHALQLSTPEVLSAESSLPVGNRNLYSPDLELPAMVSSTGIRIVPQNLVLPSPFQPHYWYQSRDISVGPFRYSYQNPVEGGDLVGVMGRYQISDRFSLGGQVYMSSAYFGPVQPTRLTNGSLQVRANYWATDWLMLYGYGQVSVNQGMNPAYMSTIGGANYVGYGMHVKITSKLGIGVGMRHSVYKGSWQNDFMYYPVLY